MRYVGPGPVRGVSFLSAFPAEKENLFPPLMFLTPRPRETQEHQIGGRKITVLNIDVELPGS